MQYMVTIGKRQYENFKRDVFQNDKDIKKQNNLIY